MNLQVVVEQTVNPRYIPQVGYEAWNFRGNGLSQGEADNSIQRREAEQCSYLFQVRRVLEAEYGYQSRIVLR